MNEKVDKNLEAMGKLILLTQKGKIEWESINPDVVQRSGQDDIISSAFMCSYKEQLLRVYLRKYKAAPKSFGLISVIVSDGKKPSLQWYSEVILELINSNGHSLWQFPKENILKDLLEAIRYKTSGAHNVIQSLLDEN